MWRHPLVTPGIIVSGVFATAAIWVPLVLASLPFLQASLPVLIILAMCLYAAAAISGAVSIYQIATILEVDKPAVYAAMIAIFPQVALVKTLSVLTQRVLLDLKSDERVKEDPDVKERVEVLSKLVDPFDLVLALITFGLHTAYYTIKSYFLLVSLAHIMDNLSINTR
ncbi:MAG TPA: hypothetical protein EYP08_01420 [Pyrodictiaceae archaeon]|nr:hypothetical protein [Pyrodictiaceae archaeon]